MFRASYLPESAALETIRYLGNERSYNPWFSALKYTSLSNKMLNGVAWQDSFTVRAIREFANLFYAVQWQFVNCGGMTLWQLVINQPL
jgi:hypothetical protein